MLVGLRSRRQIVPFTFHRPATVAEALSLRQASGTSVFMAGGMDLIDWLKYGHPVEHVIRLDGIPELAVIAPEAQGLQVGAMVTHDALMTNETVGTLLPDLALLWRQVANPRVRFTGTLGGNVMAGQAAYDALPALMALGAEVEVATAKGRQRLPAPSWFGHGREDEAAGLVTGFLIPTPAAQRLFTDRSLRPAISVWLGLTLADGTVQTLRVAIGCAYASPAGATFHLGLPLAALADHADSLAAQVVETLPEPLSDANASAAYRRRMTGVLTRRLLIRAGAAL